MGAYNSTPVTECESVDSENSRIRYGASSMQGWRRSQELVVPNSSKAVHFVGNMKRRFGATEKRDALNCCADFDPDTESMLFAVYDGHGGAEVAEYCSKMFPDFLKQMELYKENKTEEALIKAFVEFDRTLITDDTVETLKMIAKRPQSPVPPNVLALARSQRVTDDDEDDLADDEFEAAPNDCDEDETAGLLEDACMPVEMVLHRLTNGEITGPIKDSKISDSEEGESSKTAADEAKSSGEKVETTSGQKSNGVEKIGECSGSGTSNEAGSSGTSKPVADARLSSDDDDDSSDAEDFSGHVEIGSGDDSEEDEDASEEMKASHELALKFTESDDYVELPGSDSGCTACLALVRGNKLYVANAGDSRCVLSRNGKAIDLSVDHKPEDAVEKERIDKAGGFVTPDGRVNGNLNLSRAIGDHNYKRNKTLPLEEQMISALPDIQQETLTPSDDFIIVACDGIWNSLSSQECVDFVKERIDRGDKISQICEDLFHMILADDTVDGDGTGCDNMTCIIIDLQKSTRPDPKNHRTSSTGFDHTLSEDLHVAPADDNDEPSAKKAKV